MLAPSFDNNIDDKWYQPRDEHATLASVCVINSNHASLPFLFFLVQSAHVLSSIEQHLYLLTVFVSACLLTILDPLLWPCTCCHISHTALILKYVSRVELVPAIYYTVPRESEYVCVQGVVAYSVSFSLSCSNRRTWVPLLPSPNHHHWQQYSVWSLTNAVN